MLRSVNNQKINSVSFSQKQNVPDFNAKVEGYICKQQQAQQYRN